MTRGKVFNTIPTKEYKNKISLIILNYDKILNLDNLLSLIHSKGVILIKIYLKDYNKIKDKLDNKNYQVYINDTKESILIELTP